MSGDRGPTASELHARRLDALEADPTASLYWVCLACGHVRCELELPAACENCRRRPMSAGRCETLEGAEELSEQILGARRSS